MRSFLASLRTLVLPYGAGSGQRLVLDGVNGRIETYNGSNIETTQYDTDGLHLYDDAGNEIVTVAREVGNDEPMVRVQDAQGEAYVAMSIGSSADPIIDMVGYTAPGGLGIPASIWAHGSGVAGTTAQLHLEIEAYGAGGADNARLVVRGESQNGGSAARILANVPILVEGDESWHDVAFQNAWSNLGGVWQTCQYRKEPVGNVVRLRGVALGGTKTDATVITTLPVGYRPPAQEIFPVGNGTSGGVLPNIRIFPNGQIQIFGMGASTNGTHSWSGITFDAA